MGPCVMTPTAAARAKVQACSVCSCVNGSVVYDSSSLEEVVIVIKDLLIWYRYGFRHSSQSERRVSSFGVAFQFVDS